MDSESTPQPAKAIRNEAPDFQKNVLDHRQSFEGGIFYPTKLAINSTRTISRSAKTLRTNNSTPQRILPNMSIEIGNLNLAGISASERRRIADRIAAMSYEEQKQFIEQLGSVIEVNAKANAETSRKKTAIERINAAKADAQGGRATIDLLNGNLKRGGLPPVEQLVEKQPDEIMKLFAESTMASLKKMECKIALSKLKVIP